MKKRAGMWVVVVAAVLAMGGALVVFAPSGAVAPTVAFARAGALDPTFGSGGIVLTRFGPATGPGYASRLSYLVRLPDDRIVAGGSAEVGSQRVLALARYRRDGALDRTFGSGGRVLTDLPGRQASLVGLVRRRDGRLVAAVDTNSSSSDPSVHSSLAIVRYLPSGALDRRFGRGGRVILAPPLAGAPVAIARKSDERLVVVYETRLYCYEGQTCGTGVAVYQLRADGSLDRTFGSRGRVFERIPGGRATSVVIQPDHRIVVAGYADQGAMLVRFLPSGRLDRGFGVVGVAPTPSSAAYGIRAVVVARGGDLVVAGSGSSDPGAASGFAVARIRPDGRPRTSFGTGGVTFVGLADGGAESQALLREPDGRLVAGGSSSTRATRQGKQRLFFGLVRLLPDGRLDRGFGDGGRAVLPRVATGENSIRALLRQSDGRIVAGGYVSSGGTAADARFALMRFRSR